MSVLIGIFIDHGWTEISLYDCTLDRTTYRRKIGVKLDQIILDLKSEFKKKLMKIYVVNNEVPNIDLNSIADPLIHPLMIDDVDFTHYLPKKLNSGKKIVLINHNSFLYEYVSVKKGVPEYKPVKCFEAHFIMKNYLKLMLQFFECKLNRLHFLISNSPNTDWDSVDNYLEIIKRENKDFSSYTAFSYLFNSDKPIIYGKYLSNNNVQSLLKLQACDLLSKIELNTFSFKVNVVIPSYRAINSYKPQTTLMGIDLGASRIVVCVSRNGRTELIKIDQEYSMPSIISFAEDEPIIGNVAKRHLAMKPELVLSDFKHLRDTKRNLHGYSWPFGHWIEPKKSSFVFQSKDEFKQYSTIEIYQILLQKLKQNASVYQFDFNEGKFVNQAVITVPYFDNELMLADIFGAAESIALKILDIITETHADLLYFLSKEGFSIGETVAIVDIGGGTGFIEKFSFEKGFHGKHDLSFFCGREINHQLEHKLESLLTKHFEVWKKLNLKQKLEVEKIKEDFSFEAELILPPSLVQNEFIVLTRNWFEKQVLDEVLRLKSGQKIIDILKDHIYSSNISKVFLVGGTCQIPYIQKLFKTIFGEEKVIISNNLQEITATGALIHGLKILNAENEPIFQRKRIEKQLDCSPDREDNVNEPLDYKTEINSPLKTENEPLYFPVKKNESQSSDISEFYLSDKKTKDSYKPRLPPK